MRHAETVTFGGGGLERAAHLRGDRTQITHLWSTAGQVVFLWRGKPAMGRSDPNGLPDQLAWMPTDHALAIARRDQAIFLGLNAAQQGLFAVDLSDWEPEDLDAEALGGFLDPSEQRHPALPEDVVFAELRAVMTGMTPLEAEIAATAKAVIAWHDSHGFCAKCGAPSHTVDAGWQRKCDACGTPHFPRTDPVVIMLITLGDQVLLGRSPGWPEGMYSLLAGFVEPGETLEAAVRREVFEETGVKVGAVSYLSSQPWAFPMSLMFGCAGVALSSEITIDPEEIEDALWISRSDMMQAVAGEHAFIKPSRKGAIARFLIDNWLADTLD